MINLHYNKQVVCPWNKMQVEKILKKTAKLEKKIKGEVEVNILGRVQMRRINKQYRNQDKATDVLAFAWQEDKVVDSKFFGQIYICYPRIKEQAQEFNVTVKQEFTRILIHGLLHLAGYDHVKKNQAEKMFNLQEKIVSKL